MGRVEMKGREKGREQEKRERRRESGRGKKSSNDSHRPLLASQPQGTKLHNSQAKCSMQPLSEGPSGSSGARGRGAWGGAMRVGSLRHELLTLNPPSLTPRPLSVG